MTPEDTGSALDAAPGADEWPIRPLRGPKGSTPSIHVVRARKLLFGGCSAERSRRWSP